jgi:C4-dicarboxylate transporter DctQ subunit
MHLRPRAIIVKIGGKSVKILDKIEEIFISAAILFSALLVLLNVVLRLTGNGSIWSEELIRYLLIWVTFIGLSFCVRKNDHMLIDFLPGLLKGNFKKSLLLLNHSIGLLFALVFSWFSLEFINFSMNTNQLSPALNVPMYIIYIVIPISGLLMAIRYSQKIIEVLFRKAVSIE